ncbi:MAG TPA: calcium/sodium antiporter [Devosiaceae bacterium]|jgi:cation:H+ antiporter|nr:calcium/sodium antiporter [Devosiaceae bacterium]
MMVWLSLLGGFVLLVVGGELLVRGAVQVANRLGVSPLVIGLTLVGFGTSTPELMTSVQAALSGSPGIAYGNIVGSNIANTLLILGAAALLSPILIDSRALKRDGVVMVAAAIMFSLLAATVSFGWFVGAVFVAALAGYIYVAFRHESAAGGQEHGAVYEKAVAAQELDPGFRPAAAPTALLLPLLIALAGLGIVVLGGSLLVSGAVSLARSLGISETIIGLTIVAVGTSLPELVTSLVAAFRKEADVAFGNIIGSSIYNILGIGGITALFAPGRVPAEIASFDNLVMLAAACLAVGMAYTGWRIGRREGALLLLGYAGYLVWIWP